MIRTVRLLLIAAVAAVACAALAASAAAFTPAGGSGCTGVIIKGIDGEPVCIESTGGGGGRLVNNPPPRGGAPGGSPGGQLPDFGGYHPGGGPSPSGTGGEGWNGRGPIGNPDGGTPRNGGNTTPPKQEAPKLDPPKKKLPPNDSLAELRACVAARIGVHRVGVGRAPQRCEVLIRETCKQLASGGSGRDGRFKWTAWTSCLQGLLDWLFPAGPGRAWSCELIDFEESWFSFDTDKVYECTKRPISEVTP